MLVDSSPRLQALLQDRMPQARSLENIHKSQQDLHEGLPLSVADYLEYVDKTTGLTPLLAAVLYHREQCARLVRDAGIPHCQCILPIRTTKQSTKQVTKKIWQSFWHSGKTHGVLTSSCPLMQLLEHGANVHNCGAKMDQTPLRMAVTDLNMDAKMIELLVSYGASPFLEAKDGKLVQTPRPY